MLTALRVVGNLFGEQNDVWSVNTERSYSEEYETSVESER
jgi:hypothetical protein